MEGISGNPIIPLKLLQNILVISHTYILEPKDSFREGFWNFQKPPSIPKVSIKLPTYQSLLANKTFNSDFIQLIAYYYGKGNSCYRLIAPGFRPSVNDTSVLYKLSTSLFCVLIHFPSILLKFTYISLFPKFCLIKIMHKINCSSLAKLFICYS